jgi:hypothetical protein
MGIEAEADISDVSRLGRGACAGKIVLSEGA